jgi:hypothetical protein
MSEGNVNNDAGVPAHNLGEETDVSGAPKTHWLSAGTPAFASFVTREISLSIAQIAAVLSSFKAPCRSEAHVGSVRTLDEFD